MSYLFGSVILATRHLIAVSGPQRDTWLVNRLGHHKTPAVLGDAADGRGIEISLNGCADAPRLKRARASLQFVMI